jgi:hypothetical protein
VYGIKEKDMTETALAVIPETDLTILPSMTPQEQVDKAVAMAKVLQDVVKQAGLSKNFGGKKDHLFYEAWQTIGQFFNATPVTEWTHPIMEGDTIFGYEARVNVVNADGRVIASAESCCLKDEPNWKTKPLYALRSMAQTRTAGKALRSVFAWVAVLAGYSATPAEEMMSEWSQKSESQESTEQKKYSMIGNATDKQREYIEKRVGKAFDSAKDISGFYKFLKTKVAVAKDGDKEVFTKAGASDVLEHFTAYEEEYKQILEDDKQGDDIKL